ncbi:unnamed protein product [Moneuplotes crassus]|uniref:Uncharacterized protein n=1 Tax=Euplotes crassus TaxID=5936 RepID=A0AAD1XBJ0_EUPCR|nr:unnamed protein product [Moneuplotes crassus]
MIVEGSNISTVKNSEENSFKQVTTSGFLERSDTGKRPVRKKSSVKRINTDGSILRNLPSNESPVKYMNSHKSGHKGANPDIQAVLKGIQKISAKDNKGGLVTRNISKSTNFKTFYSTAYSNKKSRILNESSRKKLDTPEAKKSIENMEKLYIENLQRRGNWDCKHPRYGENRAEIKLKKYLKKWGDKKSKKESEARRNRESQYLINRFKSIGYNSKDNFSSPHRQARLKEQIYKCKQFQNMMRDLRKHKKGSKPNRIQELQDVVKSSYFYVSEDKNQKLCSKVEKSNIILMDSKSGDEERVETPDIHAKTIEDKYGRINSIRKFYGLKCKNKGKKDKIKLDNIFKSQGDHSSLSYYTNMNDGHANSTGPYTSISARNKNISKYFGKNGKEAQLEEIQQIKDCLAKANTLCSARAIEKAVLMPEELHAYSQMKSYPRPTLLSSPFNKEKTKSRSRRIRK